MIEPEKLERPDDPEFMTSLARGLAVMRCVAEAERPVTIAEASRRTGISRAATRRCLYTLIVLGYVGQEKRGYSVRRQALALGHPYLSLTALAARAQPMLDQLRDALGESCSLGVLEDDHLYYVARAEASRIMSVGLKVGSRLPAYPTSMGRILLAGRSEEEQRAYLDRVELIAQTPMTVVNREALSFSIRTAGAQGYTIVDQELEIGLRSVAVSVTVRGKVVAALNVGTAAARISLADIHERILPALLDAARKMSG
ncbi:IclR family transcriptional regulator domain-containing protein [Sphingopyxis sp. MG]|uniref:IclR family transcriptional regulator domain-containing protein n=1 Tax=Sphingopyxis sp. MG TaxID=1866325 RepID=UPI000CDF4076|nr:IclR family transcriptional regulator C-terminal domain-containing protein [Sphingopyxis sp. MG]AVA15081.1 IclR family transcriptional regulator [Sphingopyxis sp. MG]